MRLSVTKGVLTIQQSADHSFWLAWAGRRPDDKQRHTATSFQPVLTQLFSLHGKVEIDHVRVFAQLCSLENGSQLSQILDLDCFYPRVFTVTVRHHDWWNWEGDSLLSIGSEWVNNCQFPESVVQLRVELESLQRKKNQIDYVAAEMIKNWQFSRNDNIVMMAHAQDLEVSAWSGSSTWEGERWIRDETKPETNEYYVKTVVFTPNKALARKDRQVAMHIRCPGEAFETLNGSTNCLRVCDLEKAQVTPGMSADEAKKLVTDWIRAFGPTYYETYDGYYDPDEDDEDEGIEILPHPDDDGENEVSNDEGRAGASSQDLAKEH